MMSAQLLGFIVWTGNQTIKKSLLQKGFLAQNRAQKGKRPFRGQPGYTENIQKTSYILHFYPRPILGPYQLDYCMYCTPKPEEKRTK